MPNFPRYETQAAGEFGKEAFLYRIKPIRRDIWHKHLFDIDNLVGILPQGLWSVVPAYPTDFYGALSTGMLVGMLVVPFTRSAVAGLFATVGLLGVPVPYWENKEQ